MNILAINGSPRRERSNTRRLLAPLLDAARQEGADVEDLYLTDLDVRPCTGCMSCWTQTPGRCVQQDDGPAVLEKMLAADVIVLGFPLYIGGPPAGVQAMLERMLPLVEPWLVEGDGGTGHPVRHGDRLPRMVVVSNCGFPEQVNFEALRRKFAYLGVSPICMAAGEFLGAMEQMPDLAEPLAALRAALAEAGRALATTGSLPDEVAARLDRPVIEWAGLSAEDYNRMANDSFERALRVAERRGQSNG